MATDTPIAPDLSPPAEIDTWLRGDPFGDGDCQKVVSTSISWVFLYPRRVLKLKKPLNLGFLDFGSLAKREWASRRELAFNRVTAPDIYLAVRAITRAPTGVLALDGPGEVVEWAVEMRRFDETASLVSRAAAIDGALAERLGRRIARFHIDAPQGSAGGGAAGLAYVLASNAELIRGEAGDLGRDAVEDLIAETQAAFGGARDLLDARLAQGFVRCCHGDLHLGNIALEAGEPVLFDCIEFNDALREIDILYDVAFLLMDLVQRDAPGAANRALNGWLDEAARSDWGRSPLAIWEGLAALPLFQAVRATVRAHVNAMEGAAPEARRYIAAARAYLAPQAPRLLAIGGLSGSGKSTLARAIAPGLGAAPGAVILRSDEIRKRLAGVEPTARLPPAAYTAEAGARVYAQMLAEAKVTLSAGRAVICDAVFLKPGERVAVEAVAREAGAPFHGLWLEAPRETLEERLRGRRKDASDADIAVLARQLTADAGDVRWLRAGSDISSPALAGLHDRLGIPLAVEW